MLVVKKRFYLLLLLVTFPLLLVCCGPHREDTYCIEGQVINDASTEGKKVYLYDANEQAIDSATVHDGQFKMRGHLPSDPYLCKAMLSISKAYELPLILEGGDTIEAIMSSISATGTAQNDALRNFLNKLDTIETVYYEVYRQRALDHFIEDDLHTNLDTLYDSMNRQKIELGITFLKEHPNDMVGIWALTQIMESVRPSMKDYDLNEIIQISGSFVQNCPFLRPKFFQHNNLIRTSRGQYYTDFNGKDNEGNSVKLSDLRREGCYTLLFFSNSQCKPCMEEKLFLYDLYKQYKRHNIQFIEVVIQENPEKISSQEDEVPWPILIDDREEAYVRYNVQAVPESLLIDPDGYIVERNMRSLSLRDHLDSIFSINTYKKK